MRRYETIFILEPDVSEEQRKPLFEKIDELFNKYKGLLIKRDEWGVKHLAYSVRKLKRGFYTRLEYCGDGTLVDEMERFFRINDRFMKYLTVVLDKDADIEKVKEEIAQAEAEAAARQKSAEEAAQKAAAAAAEKASAEASPAEKAVGETAAAEETPETAAEASAEAGAQETVAEETTEVQASAETVDETPEVPQDVDTTDETVSETGETPDEIETKSS